MRADACCLILDDDPGQLERLRVAAIEVGMTPLAARSPAKALALLDQIKDISRPVLAVLDRDMANAPDQSRSSLEVLRHMAVHFPECIVLVYSANISTVDAQVETWRTHPRALLHDKRSGDAELFGRVRALLPTVGALTVEHAAVRHLEPNCVACQRRAGGDRHGHWVAVSLLMNYPGAVYLKSETMTRAARRFNDWLAEHNASAAVVALGDRKYRLESRSERTETAEADGA